MFKNLIRVGLFIILLGLSLPSHAPVQADDPPSCEALDNPPHPRYELHALLNWVTREADVKQTVHYINNHGEPLNELVLHVEAERPERQIMTINSITAEDGTLIDDSTLESTTLTIPLPEAVGENCEAVVRLDFSLDLGEISGSNPYGWLAYTNRQTNLAHWFPVMAVYGFAEDGEWYNPPPHRLGEQTITDLSDFDLIFELENAPNGIAVVAPGTVTQSKGNVWHIIHQNARDLALSLSTQYQLNREHVGDVTIDFYTFTSTPPGAVEQAVKDAHQAFALYKEVYGDYLYKRLVLIESDFPDGLELSGLVYISADWFNVWNKTPVHWLTAITVHEVSHQWFYTSVATDQAMLPYLDESLATYSELIYYEHYYPDEVDAWWEFRIDRFDLGDDPVDSPVYDYTTWRPYINTVYFRGVYMLNEIRGVIGDDEFYEWLATYYADNASNIATSTDFWNAMSGIAYDATGHIRMQFLAEANPRD